MESKAKRRVSTRGKQKQAEVQEITQDMIDHAAADDGGDHRKKTPSTSVKSAGIPHILVTPRRVPLPGIADVHTENTEGVSGTTQTGDDGGGSYKDKRTPAKAGGITDIPAIPLKISLPEMAGTHSVDVAFKETTGLMRLRSKIQEELVKETRPKPDASPGLVQLRSTPGRGLKEKQRELIQKHEQIRQHSDKLSVGGGVSLWPNMNEMRLSRMEVISLVILCLVLVAGTGWLFVFLHGDIFRSMLKLTADANNFPKTHSLKYMGRKEGLQASFIGWHTDFRTLLGAVDKALNVSRPSLGYQIYIATYLAAFGILVYFLVDNMWSKSKLSPGRIKKWVCLLVVVSQWTIMLCVLFVSAQQLESALVSNVLHLSEKLGEFLEHDIDMNTLVIIAQYWRGQMLPPMSHGTIWVLGVVPLQDLTTYLQYYCLPVLTVLVTPVVRLCLALQSVYSKPSKDL